MDKINLSNLGLTEIESKVYLVLIQLGSTKTGALIKKTELHRATVYDVLKRLQEKGLVSFITKEKTKYFQTTDPEHFLELIKEKENEIKKKEQDAKEIINQLKKIQEQAKIKENASIFQGKKGIKTIFEDVLNYKEYLAFASKGKFEEILGDYFYQFQKRKKQLKIKSKILIDETLKGTNYAKFISGEIRFLQKEQDYPSATFIYGNKVAIIVFTEYPTAFLIESKEVYESYKSYFEILWKQAK